MDTPGHNEDGSCVVSQNPSYVMEVRARIGTWDLDSRGDAAMAEVLLSLDTDETHVRLAGTNGFVTGLGGIAALPVTLPVGVGGYYLLGARLAAAAAHLRGEELHSEHVRSAVLITLLGSAGTEVLKEAGVKIGTKGLAAALKRVPGRIFIEINKKVGFRLVTKGETTGVINMGKLIPLAGGPIGATTVSPKPGLMKS